MASFPKGKGNYHRVIFRKTYNGNQRSKTFYFKKSEYTRTEVRDWMRRKEMDFKGGDWSPWDKESRVRKGGMTIKEAIDSYKPVAKQQLAESSFTVRFYYLSYFQKFAGAGRPVNNITEVANKWINQGTKHNTKKKRKTVLSMLYDHLIEKGIVDEKPKFKVLSTKAQRNRARTGYKTYIKPEEFQAVKDTVRKLHEHKMSTNVGSSPKYRKYREFEKEFPYVFDFLVNTAIRKNDLLNLDTEWFYPDLRFMDIGGADYLPKSRQIDKIPLTFEAREIAQRWIDKYGQPAKPFKNITKDWYTKFFKRVFRKALPNKASKLSAHKMRDTAAMYLLHQKGYSPQTVQQITRHRELSTLMIYLHSAPEQALNEIENKGG